ncbi:MAG TPA: periplasmic heavy metal sensor [Planctomycetes bacterium]|nr:periplasmic heavy metal sensor [Planctomycetota bacterium]
MQGAMSGKGISGKRMFGKGQMDGMEMMGRMKGMKAMGGRKPAKPLSAFPDAPGIEHVGASDFFLDQVSKIPLSPEQQAALERIRDEAMSEQVAFDAQIEKAEEQVGELTGSGHPGAAKMEAKVREIERLRADRRLAFIRAAGRAASILTDDQRKTLTEKSSRSAEEPATQPPEPRPTPPAAGVWSFNGKPKVWERPGARVDLRVFGAVRTPTPSAGHLTRPLRLAVKRAPGRGPGHRQFLVSPRPVKGLSKRQKAT